MISEITLIGSISAGKGTVGKLLSDKLKSLDYVDEFHAEYYKEIGYGEAIRHVWLG